VRWLAYMAVFTASFLLFLDFFLPKEHIADYVTSRLKADKNLSLNLEGYEVESFLYLVKLKARYAYIAPLQIARLEDVSASNTLFAPSVFDISAKSGFGFISGVVDTASQKAHLSIQPNNEFESIKPALTALLKTELNKTKGGYCVDLSY
jgi:hypothetical protein